MSCSLPGCVGRAPRNDTWIRHLRGTALNLRSGMGVSFVAGFAGAASCSPRNRLVTLICLTTGGRERGSRRPRKFANARFAHRKLSLYVIP